MKVVDNQLSEAQLSKLAKKVTKCRKIQRDRALEVNQDFNGDRAEAYLRTTEKLARRMHNGGYFKLPKEENIYKEPHLTK